MKAFLILAVLFTYKAQAKGVLIIGDSLSVPDGHGLGREVEKKLKSQGHNVTTVASCGAAPANYASIDYTTKCGFYQSSLKKKAISVSYWGSYIWAGRLTPKLDQIYDGSDKPALIMIQQGTNLYRHVQNNTPEAARNIVAEEVAKLLKKKEEYSASSKCLWIGPPEIQKMNEKIIEESQKKLMIEAIQEGIRRSGSECSFFDPRTVTGPPGGDGTHFNSIGQTQAWIDESYRRSLELLKDEEVCAPETTLIPRLDAIQNNLLKSLSK